ncbi:MAG: hypothetical protein ABJG33_00075 [Balneola sp.]
MVGSTYTDSLVITRASEAGSLNSETGKFTPSGSATTVYNGLCDAQEISSSGLSFSGSELKKIKADMAIYLKDESALFSIKIGDTGVLTREGNNNQVIVEKVRIIDGMIEANISEN